MNKETLKKAFALQEEMHRLQYDLSALDRIRTGTPLFVTGKERYGMEDPVIMVPEDGVQEILVLIHNILLRELAKAEKRLEEL